MVVETRLYDILGVPPHASTEDIRRAYRKLALKHHPDRGGDTRKFQEVSSAHQVLTDSQQREIYDQHGEAGLRHMQQMGAGGGQPTDGAAQPDADFFQGVFGDLFGAGGLFGSGGLFGNSRPSSPSGFRRSSQRPRPEDIVLKLSVTLEELFNGVTRSVSVRRTAACTTCAGSGMTHPGAQQSCSACDGYGVQTVIRQLGPGMMQRLQQTCPVCQGLGRFVPQEYVCKACRGDKVTREKRNLDVNIPPGCHSGTRLRFAGAGHAPPGCDASDVVCMVEGIEHPRFARRRNDLCATETITLVEALCGCAVRLEHLDGRVLKLRTKPGDVIKPRSWWRVKAEGMPILEEASARGDLFMRFDVTFPEKLDSEVAHSLGEALRPTRSQGAERRSGFFEKLSKFFWRSDAHSSEGTADHAERSQVPDGVVEYLMEEVPETERPDAGARPSEKPYSRL